MNGNPIVTIDGLGPLTPEIPPRPSFDARIQRAHVLSAEFPASSEMLRFYAKLAFCQQSIFELLQSSNAESIPTEGWPLLTEMLGPLFPEFAKTLAEFSPPPLAERASQLAIGGADSLLADTWDGNLAQSSDRSDAADRLVAFAFLQPYAEWLAQQGNSKSAVTRNATCPVCSSAPVCAVLRERDHGSSRALICSLCMNEWIFERLLCPSCGEDRNERLPVFTPEGAQSYVCLHACDTCKTYIKTIDLSKMGVAVPVVDEIASLPLTLWAVEKGYAKLANNVLGM